jgi:protoporphyrinogen/coproporphyrinogen III oxidase
MVKGQIFGARERKRRGEVAKDRAPKFSFDEGLQVLPDTLAAQLGETVRLNTAATKLAREATGWRVETPSGTALHDAVVYCGSAHKLAALRVELVASGRQLDLTAFSEIRHPPVASVVLGFRREDVAHSCAGFGMLIPRMAGFKILGTIFSSSLFPNRAPAGHLTLTTYVGGERYPELASLPADQLYQTVCEDLRVLLGARGQPTFQHTILYPKAIPQYNVGYGRFKNLLNEIEAQAPGLFFAGHYRDGISLSDSMVSGISIVERVESALHSSQTVAT